MSRLGKLSPLDWAEVILSRIEAVQKDLAKLTTQVREMHAALHSLEKACAKSAGEEETRKAGKR